MKKLKRILAMFLVLLMCGQSFAAVVSDNDGSAFITKAEFDSLKNNFQSQIDNYNSSIDSKIDGAIAAYLAGIQVSTSIDLSLPSEKGYIFPLKYDTNSNWNNMDSAWFMWMRPECHRIIGHTDVFHCRYDDGQNENWKMTQSTEQAYFRITGSAPSQTWFGALLGTYTLNITGKNGEGFEVARSTQTKSVNGANYYVYDLQTFGVGHPVVNYQADISASDVPKNIGNVATKTSRHLFYYPKTFGIAYNWQSRGKVSTEDVIWRPNSLGWGGGGNGNSSECSPTFPKVGECTLKDLFDDVNIPRGAEGLSKCISNSSKIDSYSISWETTGSISRIYGRGANCPIISNNYNFELVNSPNIETPWWEQVYSYDGVKWAGICSSASRNIALFEAGDWGFLPRNKVASNTTYDATDVDFYSQLPSTLVQYNTVDGDKHYIDEGMWLGKIDAGSGDVEFVLRFGKDAGAGTKVKLHVSKKPFAYDYDATQLIEIKVNGNPTGQMEPELDYGTDYKITINDIKKGDNLYLEWIPVDANDLPTLISFDQYKLIASN